MTKMHMYYLSARYPMLKKFILEMYTENKFDELYDFLFALELD
jgi:hypothetical protein